MRCFHCNQKLPVYARALLRHFCNEAHKQAYHCDRDRLVVEALRQTWDLIGSSLPQDGEPSTS